MNIGLKIKQLRESRGYTQKQLAEACGLAEITIRQYEKNSRKPKIENLMNIALALHVPLNEMLDSTEEPNLQDFAHQFDKRRSRIKDTLYLTFRKEDDKRSLNNSQKGTSSFKEWKNGAWKSDEYRFPLIVIALLEQFMKFNATGRQEAIKRLEELTRLEEYTKPDPPESAGSDASPLMSNQTPTGTPEDGVPAAEPNNDNSINPDKP